MDLTDLSSLSFFSMPFNDQIQGCDKRYFVIIVQT